MTSQSKDDKTLDKISTGGHLGGTHLGHNPDAKTSSSVDRKGDKARANDAKQQPRDFDDDGGE